MIDTNEMIDQTPDQEASADALNSCQQELLQWKDKFIQVNADLANFRRRVEKDQLQWTTMAQNRLMTPLLIIVDTIDRAVAEKPATSDERVIAWIKGIEMIHGNIQKFLQAFDIKEVPTTGEFNPEYHEALMHVESDTHPSGTIVAVLEKGYMMGNTVLRVAKVSVAQ